MKIKNTSAFKENFISSMCTFGMPFKIKLEVYMVQSAWWSFHILRITNENLEPGTTSQEYKMKCKCIASIYLSMAVDLIQICLKSQVVMAWFDQESINIKLDMTLIQALEILKDMYIVFSCYEYILFFSLLYVVSKLFPANEVWIYSGPNRCFIMTWCQFGYFR